MYWFKPWRRRDDAGYAGTRLSVVDAVTAAHHHLWSKLESEADARLNVVPVGHIVCTLLGIGEYFAAVQRKVYWIPVTGSV